MSNTVFQFAGYEVEINRESILSDFFHCFTFEHDEKKVLVVSIIDKKVADVNILTVVVNDGELYGEAKKLLQKDSYINVTSNNGLLIMNASKPSSIKLLIDFVKQSVEMLNKRDKKY